MIKNFPTGEAITKLTPDEFAELIKKSKPYLIKLEEEVEKLQNGTIKLEINVRQGVVEKMVYTEVLKNWLRAHST